jgi:hypothetical protein
MFLLGFACRSEFNPKEKANKKAKERIEKTTNKNQIKSLNVAQLIPPKHQARGN